MGNVLKKASENRQPAFGNGMAVGDQRILTDSNTGRTWTLTRTDRPYAYDLADAYNAGLPYDSNLIWIVGGVKDNEQLKLITKYKGL